MKCEYCKLQGKCNRKWYECDRQLVIRGKELVCEPAEVADKIELRRAKREYHSEEKVTFLGFVFNRVKIGGYTR